MFFTSFTYLKAAYKHWNWLLSAMISSSMITRRRHKALVYRCSVNKFRERKIKGSASRWFNDVIPASVLGDIGLSKKVSAWRAESPKGTPLRRPTLGPYGCRFLKHLNSLNEFNTEWINNYIAKWYAGIVRSPRVSGRHPNELLKKSHANPTLIECHPLRFMYACCICNGALISTWLPST